MENTNILPALGGLESPKDARDWTLAVAGASQAFPPSCFLDTDWMLPTMQSQIGCCVGCTSEETIRQLIYLATGTKHQPGTDLELSFRFVYAVCKALEGTIQPDGSDYTAFRKVGPNEGTYAALAAKVLRKYGVPLAKFCPNDVTLSADDFIYGGKLSNIPAAAFADAATRKSGADFVPTHGNTVEGVKEALNYAKLNKGGVMILRRIGATYWQDANGNRSWDKNKILPIRATPSIVAGHCEFLTGYEDEQSTGKTKISWLNHWSDKWGDNGRGWEYLDQWLPYFIEIRVIVPAVPTVDNFKYTFGKVLKYGDQGPDVVALQHILKLEGCYPASLPFTGKFLNKTLAGVNQLQTKYYQDILKPVGLLTPTGIVGPQTINWLNAHYGNK